MSYCAVLDANVLYPSVLRSVLIHIAQTGVFWARWTRCINEEWIQAVNANTGADLVVLRKCCDAMNEAVRDCLVEGYEELIPSLELPDENDRHVLAAAIMGKADAIVTFNLKDFPDNTLAAYGVQAIHPDDFLINQIDIDQTTVLGALRQTRQNLSKSNLSADELIDKLEHGGLPQSAARLRPLKILI